MKLPTIKIKLLLLLIVLLTGFSQAKICAQNAPQESSKSLSSLEVKADQIISRSKQTIGRKIKIEDIKGWSAVWTSTQTFSNGMESNEETKINVSLPDKMQRLTTADYGSNIITTTGLLNNLKGKYTSENLVNGKPIQIQDNAKKPSFEENAVSLKRVLVFDTLSMFLTAPAFEPIKFDYVGEAESKDGQAEVVSATKTNGFKYLLFFDKETHLLLLISYTTKRNTSADPNETVGTTETKLFFSDYQEKDGVLIAHKVTAEENGKFSYERALKKIKINPIFDSDYFEIK